MLRSPHDRRPGRQAFTLVEILVALALMGLLLAVLTGLLSSGTTGAARARQEQTASVVASRVLDRVLASGYAHLAACAGSDLDLAALPEGCALAGSTVDCDGTTFTVGCHVEEVEDGLVRVDLTLTWSRPAKGQDESPRRLSLLRYVADPMAGLHVRGPAAGDQA